ncbi:DUF551 domain-containing protein [Klebsiella pneumoniae]|nr:DUF551 domain-containing protein [Klebsiella pneumoniae]
MTKSTITDKRVTSVIERLEHYACNLKWTNVRGAQDLLTAADGLRELQERRKADSEPVILYRQVNPANGMKTYWAELDQEEFRHLKKYTDENAEFMTLYRQAQPVPVVPKSISVRQAISALESVDAVTTIGQAYKMGWNACRAAMLQELKKSAGTEAICRSDENVQVLHTKSPAQSDCCPAQNQGWIPVSERMPDENAEQQVLACFKGGDISTLYYFEGRWDDAYGIVPIRQDVTHWMPLPAAPQEAINVLIPLVSRNEREVK